jgi:hypothetical protein
MAQATEGFTPVAGSIKITADCGHECYCSPGTVDKAFDGEIVTQCVECFGGDDKIKAAVISGKAMPSDLQELMAEMRKLMYEPIEGPISYQLFVGREIVRLSGLDTHTAIDHVARLVSAFPEIDWQEQKTEEEWKKHE